MSLKTHNPIEWILNEALRRAKFVNTFPHDRSELMLVDAKSRHISSISWGLLRKHTGVELLNQKN